MNSRFTASALSFSDYCAQAQDFIRRARQRCGLPAEEEVVLGNAPFELSPVGNTGEYKPYRRGVLLLHGLSDSPYHLRHLAVFFQRQGLRVFALLLPGHGTQPGDLLEVRWQDWSEAVAYGADRLAAEVETLYLAGFSAGAALAVRHAAGDARVRGLFLFAPALAIPARARWAGLHRAYSWLYPQHAWLQLAADSDPYKYESFCKNAVSEMYALTRALPQTAPEIPVFAAASADDATVHAAATLRFMQRVRHPLRRLVWYVGAVPAMPVSGFAADEIEIVNCHLPEQRILSSAHTAIVLPPQDAHYGAEGDYANCLHYACGSREQVRCRQQPEYLGEVLPSYLQRGVLRRLTYNPHYARLEQSLQNFIIRLGE